MMPKPTLIIHWFIGATIAALLVSAAHAQTFQGQAVNVTQLKGATVDAGNGATSPATQRVTISNDSTGLVTTPAVGTNSTTAPTHSVLIGVSDSVNLQPLLAPFILGDGVNGNNMVATGPYLYNGTSTNLNRQRDIIGAVSAGTGTAATALAPTSAAGGAIVPVVSAAAEASHVLKAAAGNFYSLTVTTGASAGYLMIDNATSAPADGAVTPIMCVSVPASSTVTIGNPGEPPTRYGIGMVAVFSTTGCFAQTASATAFFSAKVQ